MAYVSRHGERRFNAGNVHCRALGVPREMSFFFPDLFPSSRGETG